MKGRLCIFRPRPLPTTFLDLKSIAILLAIAAITWPVVKWLKIPAGLLLGGMAISGVFYLTDTFHAPLPDWLAVPGFLTIGAMVGTRFGSVSLSQLARLAWISLLSLFVSMAVSLLAALIGWKLLGFSLGQTFLAYAPGGFETMVLLAFLFDLNPAFVAGHHLVRYLGLVIVAPAIILRLTRQKKT
ncbi:AbrB family transcriptional regulator [uncultured Cohaesibacter sp.]|uniref:AbrB family transcriptional regulator n=1 Tax=uncultured Cohaesibacter sp. TaxID=1002546 RepID=UPI0029C74D3E|nr:AbrB family transcriptional regulator [uncultured Cohaesibacter sp.]